MARGLTASEIAQVRELATPRIEKKVPANSFCSTYVVLELLVQYLSEEIDSPLTEVLVPYYARILLRRIASNVQNYQNVNQKDLSQLLDNEVDLHKVLDIVNESANAIVNGIIKSRS